MKTKKNNSPKSPMDAKWYYTNLDELSPAPESIPKSIGELIQPKYNLFIGGKFVEPNSKKYFDTINPANGKKLSSVASANKVDVDNAVKSAQKGFRSWQKLPPTERSKYLYSLARIVQRNSRQLAIIETLDNGKPIRETRDIDIPLVVRHFYHHAGWATTWQESFPNYTSLGVIGQIIPWNFPLLMLAWKIAPALAAGNSVILKPAEFTPLSALYFTSLLEEINFPKGVINIITGNGETGSYLVNHPDVAKIAFTGSTEVGKKIMVATSNTHKKLSMELGGKSAFIVFDSASIDDAIEGVVDGIYFNQGQVCCAGSRLILQENIYSEFIRKLKLRMSKLVIGDPMDKAVDMGAINSPQQLQKITNMISQGKSEGAKIWNPDWACPKDGYWYPPTLVENTTPSNILVREEIFGPVLVAIKFRTPNEAVQIANNSPFGLAASIWTQQVDLGYEISKKLLAGTIWWNCTNQFDASAPFGGFKESGFGREGGRIGMFEYLKPINSNWKSSAIHKQSKNKQNISKPIIDQTIKHFIGGKEVRPDGGMSVSVNSFSGKFLGEVPLGNRKDIRNAVEAARNGNDSWKSTTTFNRMQLLMFLAERCSERFNEISEKLSTMTGRNIKSTNLEIQKSIERLMYWGGRADKLTGELESVNGSHIVQTWREPIGVIGITIPDEFPFLAFISRIAPALAYGNSIIVIPSEKYPLSISPFIEIIRAGDIPTGAIQIVFGKKMELASVLSQHSDVDGINFLGSEEECYSIKKLCAQTVKRVNVNYGVEIDWFDNQKTQGERVQHDNCESKTLWIPYGSGIN